uniref:Putative tick salivary cystatin n=1 Tax=Rhipicephalus pulchellus TaxID=72859 RepID=L7LPS6_RHIPC
MTAIKQTCLVLLGVLLGSCYASMPVEITSLWTYEEAPWSPHLLKLAHYAVSTQTGGRTVYDTVVNITAAMTQTIGGADAKLTFTTAPSSCRIGQVAYSAKKCLPAGPANKKCIAYISVAPVVKTKKVANYTCSSTRN